jgi:hypothetical protein
MRGKLKYHSEKKKQMGSVVELFISFLLTVSVTDCTVSNGKVFNQ